MSDKDSPGRVNSAGLAERRRGLQCDEGLREHEEAVNARRSTSKATTGSRARPPEQRAPGRHQPHACGGRPGEPRAAQAHLEANGVEPSQAMVTTTPRRRDLETHKRLFATHMMLGHTSAVVYYATLLLTKNHHPLPLINSFEFAFVGRSDGIETADKK